MEKKYVYRRLFDFCVNNNTKNPGRGVIRRRGRILTGISSYIFIIVMFLLFILETSNIRWISILGAIAAFGFIFETRMGIFSWINVLVLANLTKKIDQNILEKFCIYHNRDGNYIKIQEKNIYTIKYHPFCWTIVKIYLKDEFNNKYIFRINLKVVSLKLDLSSVYRKSYLYNNKVEMKLRYEYSINDLIEITDVNELLMFFKKKYSDIRAKMVDIQ